MPVAVEALAEELHRARLTRTPVETLTSRAPQLDRAAAYAIQAHGIALREADGERVVGGKLGFTSRAMQQAMGVHEPNHGWLTDAMLVDGPVVPLDTLIHPKAEPEIAFVLGRDLDRDQPGGVTAADVIAATDAVCACLEVVDSRYAGFRFAPLDNIADDSSAGLVVLGEPVALTDRDREELSLALVGCVVEVDGTVVATAAGAAALDDPAAAVAWMATTAEQPLRAGHVVLSGGLTAPVDLAPGTRVRARFDRLGDAELTAA